MPGTLAQPAVASGSLLSRARPLMLARGAAAAISFAIPLALVRAFEPADYGTYKLLFVVAQSIYYTIPFGVPQALYYFLPRVADGRPYLMQTMLAMAAIGALSLGGLLALGPTVSGWLNSPGLSRHVPALALYTFGLIASCPLETTLTSLGRTRLSSAFYLGSEALKAAAMTVPALVGLGLSGVMWGVAGFALLRTAVAWMFALRQPGAWFEPAAWRAQLRYALPFGAAVALAIPQQYFHQYVVSARFDAATFAVYAVGMFQLPVIDLLYVPTTEMLMVSLGELDRQGDGNRGAALFREAVARLAFFFVPATAFLVAAAPAFVEALFTSRYSAATPLFRVGVAATLLACLPVDGVLRARGETGYLFWSYAAKAALTIPVVLAGVARFGLLGAIGGWLACESAGKLMLFARVPRALGAGVLEVLPGRALARIGAAAGVGVVALWTLDAALGVRLPAAGRLALGAAAYGACYLAASWTLGMRPPRTARPATPHPSTPPA